jgi:exopolysaccharide biosynthesis polyprenyl glycosylphosphotransferase
MLRRDRQIKNQIQQVLDACLFGLGFWIAWSIRSNPWMIEAFNLKEVHPFPSYVYLYLVMIIAGPIMLEIQGFYDRPLLPKRWVTLWTLFKGCISATIVLIFVIYFFRVDLARGVAILFGGVCFVLIYLKEEMVQLGMKSKFAQNQYQRKFILLGTAEETSLMRTAIKSTPEDGIHVIAELDLNADSLGQLTQLLDHYSVNGVILNARHNYFERVESAIHACEREGVEVWLVADFFRTQISRTSFDMFRGRPVLIFRSAPEESMQRVVKQVLDFALAFITLAALSLPLLIISALIKMGSPGPVLFRQKRSGLNGQPFTIFKFRTMGADAEEQKQGLQKHNEMSGPVFKMTNDPRVTPIGKFLRKYSIDEVPQLLNILRGEMSIVGPRPLPVDEVKRFDDRSHRRRLSVNPGLTCLWQISGRNEVSDFNEWVRLDLEYIDNWTIWLDLKIMLLTFPVVLQGTGAK